MTRSGGRFDVAGDQWPSSSERSTPMGGRSGSPTTGERRTGLRSADATRRTDRTDRRGLTQRHGEMERLTTEQAWDRFLRHAAHAMQKPTFDLEERDDKLATAERLRAWLEAAREAHPTSKLGALFAQAAGSQQ